MFIPLLIIFLWCNGNTSDSGSDDRGSSPCRKTQLGKHEFSSLAQFFLYVLNLIKQTRLYQGLYFISIIAVVYLLFFFRCCVQTGFCTYYCRNFTLIISKNLHTKLPTTRLVTQISRFFSTQLPRFSRFFTNQLLRPYVKKGNEYLAKSP